MTLEVRLIITLALLGLFLLSRVLLEIVKKRHANDPEYQEEKRRREEEYRQRIEKENDAIRQFEMINEQYTDYDYSDNEYEEDSIAEPEETKINE